MSKKGRNQAVRGSMMSWKITPKGAVQLLGATSRWPDGYPSTGASSGSKIKCAILSRYFLMISLLLSVDPGSTTIYSKSSYSCSKTDKGAFYFRQ